MAEWKSLVEEREVLVKEVDVSVDTGPSVTVRAASAVFFPSTHLRLASDLGCDTVGTFGAPNHRLAAYFWHFSPT